MSSDVQNYKVITVLTFEKLEQDDVRHLMLIIFLLISHLI